jgi:RHS repeat-associated protein
MLGSTRFVTNAAAEAKERHDYLPFGEELFGGTIENPGLGGRLTSQGYPSNQYASGVRQKFTQKERDNETGLDYFGARYYASNLGRFTSPDPEYFLIQLVSPQIWNRYAYVLNNPLEYIDQNGKWPTWIHELIIDNAFPGLSDEEREFIKWGSWYVDAYGTHLGGTLAESNANEHAMRRPDQTYLEAVLGYRSFIETKNAEAAALVGGATSGIDESLIAFGEATHPISDNVSPTHTGFQVYNGIPFPAPDHISAF